jgi:molecular chaperone HtpG
METHKFQAEVNQVLHLVIHSLYSHKEVFLRELISNASDALDKLRFRAVTEPELLADDARLEIRLSVDREKGTLTVEDTGVGMSHAELTDNLGTIARSGSRAFLDAVAQSGGKPINLIGQFGVGFYSAYLVADRVEVVSRAAGAQGAFRWASEAKDTFTVEPAEKSSRGTAVTLHLRDDQKHFLDEWTLKDLVRRYSDYVSHPILLGAETVNRASALWQRPRSEITDEQYDEFYKHLTHDHEAPLARTHFRVEGTQEFVGLLFVPKNPPIDLELHLPRRGVRLFVRRVFVMDNCEELLPEWLRFLRGVVDSDDLPLNVSREVLQDSSIVRAIRKHLVKKALDLLEELARDKPEAYATFWEGFGAVLKSGLHLDPGERARLAQLVRFHSSAATGVTALADYVKRMKPDQEAIYYAFGESRDVLAKGPHTEALLARGYEILYMTDPVDEWAVEGLGDYDGKPLRSVMRAELKLGSDEEKRAREEQAGVLAPLLGKMRAVLQEVVEEVRVSDRLAESPACLVVPEGAHHASIERLLQRHGHKLPKQKRILEVNPQHPLIASLSAIHAREPSSEKLAEWIELLYDQALLTEGGTLADPNRFARRMTDLLARAAASLGG